MRTDLAAPVTRVAYTAFGEVVLPDGQGGWKVGGEAPAGYPRYGYDGGWGYESGMITLYGDDPTLPPIVLQHVGERWYQPDTGRFVQRDPIGIGGGLNVYDHGRGNPLILVDPDGEFFVVLGVAIGIVNAGAAAWNAYWAWKAASYYKRPDFKHIPANGRDPRNDGRLTHCVRLIGHAGQLPGTLPGWLPPGVRPMPPSPVPFPGKPLPDIDGWRPPHSNFWDWVTED